MLGAEMRLIDADELMERVWRERLDTRERIAEMIESMPTVNRTVRFVPISKNLSEVGRCECGDFVNTLWSYCPHCGAKLER